MTKIKLAIGAVFVALLAFLRAFIRKDAKEDMQHEISQETSRRVQAGREKVIDGRASGSTPAERVQNNDAKWGGV